MTTFSVIVLGLTVLYNAAMALVMHTENLRSAMLFKVTPVAIAIGLVVVIFIEMGMIVQMPTGG